jgi:hypothetical protein
VLVMTRPQRSYGRPGTAVIPEGWGASHAQPVAGRFTATVNLRAPGSTTTWVDDPDGGHTEVTPLAPFATGVPARIRPIGAGGGPGEQAVDVKVQVAGYLVSLPLDADGVDLVVVDAESSTLVDVTASDDVMLTGRSLRVQDVERGSLRVERTLLCVLNN